MSNEKTNRECFEHLQAEKATNLFLAHLHEAMRRLGALAVNTNLKDQPAAAAGREGGGREREK